MIEWAITSSVLIFVVLALRRLLMGKISLRLQYGLWALVLVRLLVPVSFGATAVSILNLVENATISNPVVGYMGGHTIQLSISEPDPTLPLEEQQKQYEKNLEQWQAEMDADRAENGTPISLGTVLLGVWAAGSVILGLWFLWVNVRFAQKLRRSSSPLAQDCPLPVYVTEASQTPCLFGLLHPSIYVTEEAAADETVLRHSLAHELTHYRHGDHIWAALRGLCLALHWYNPLVWAAAALSRPVNLLNLRYLGLGASAACFVTWNFALRRLGAVKTSVYIYLVPVVTIFTSALVLHERITPLAALGTALTMLGLFLSEFQFKRKAVAEGG